MHLYTDREIDRKNMKTLLNKVHMFLSGLQNNLWLEYSVASLYEKNISQSKPHVQQI